MEPRERARRPRPHEPDDDDDRDDLPWLQDEAPPAGAVPPRPVEPPRSGGRGPWWSRLIGGDTEPTPKKPARPFEGPTDAETVVASRDELLRAVREYMGGRSSPILDAADARDRAASERPRPTDAPAVIRRTPPRAPIDDLAPDDLPAPPPPAEPYETRKMKAPLVPPGATLPPARTPPPAQTPPPVRTAPPPPAPSPAPPPGRTSPPGPPARTAPSGAPGRDIFDDLETRRARSGAPVDPADGPPADGPRAAPPPRRPAAGDASPPRSAAPAGPSAMSRERLLPGTGRPRRRAERPEAAEPSLSSFSLGDDGRDRTPYPQAFITPGLRLLMTRQWGPALDFYREETKRNPSDAAMLYGQAAALLALDRLEEAAPCLVRAHDLDPAFPMARLIGDACPDDPISWYNLAAALVAERNRSAYLCAEVILTECLGGADDDQLRGRAQRVQRDIARMLDQRSKRDEMHREEVPWHETLGQPVVLLGLIAVILVIGMVWRVVATSPPAGPPAPSVAPPSPSASARVLASPQPVRKR